MVVFEAAGIADGDVGPVMLKVEGGGGEKEVVCDAVIHDELDGDERGGSEGGDGGGGDASGPGLSAEFPCEEEEAGEGVADGVEGACDGGPAGEEAPEGGIDEAVFGCANGGGTRS